VGGLAVSPLGQTETNGSSHAIPADCPKADKLLQLNKKKKIIHRGIKMPEIAHNVRNG
jgi:hypothetical protein